MSCLDPIELNDVFQLYCSFPSDAHTDDRAVQPKGFTQNR
jgi:hypothetical protein